MILLRPVASHFDVSQEFGENPSWYPNTNGHNGIDFSVPVGTPVYAAADGVVSLAELDTTTAQDPNRGYGYHIRIQHANNFTTIYGHFMDGGLLVSTGEHVQAGQTIGQSGNTGFSTGPHLHFEVRTGSGVNTGVNPRLYMVEELPAKAEIFHLQLAENHAVNIRSGPGMGFHVVRTRADNEPFKVLGLAGNDVWLQVEDGFMLYRSPWYVFPDQE